MSSVDQTRRELIAGVKKASGKFVQNLRDQLLEVLETDEAQLAARDKRIAELEAQLGNRSEFFSSNEDVAVE